MFKLIIAETADLSAIIASYAHQCCYFFTVNVMNFFLKCACTWAYSHSQWCDCGTKISISCIYIPCIQGLLKLLAILHRWASSNTSCMHESPIFRLFKVGIFRLYDCGETSCTNGGEIWRDQRSTPPHQISPHLCRDGA